MQPYSGLVAVEHADEVEAHQRGADGADGMATVAQLEKAMG
jgi:hypothetical protein